MDNNNGGGVIAIVIFIILFLFFVIICIGIVLSSKNNNNSIVVDTVNGLLSACTTTPCSGDLACDGNTFTCKLPEGALCTDSTDCVTGLICSGICTSGPTGNINQFCPCLTILNYYCVSGPNNTNICKGGANASCGTGSDCISNICDNGLCAAGAADSAPCTTGSDCGSGFCSSGFCQQPGIATGTRGAACAGGCVNFVGATCNSTPAAPLSCVCNNGPDEPGTCSTPQQGILSSCSSNTPCANDLVCFTNGSPTECTGTTGCYCAFPYNNPNAAGTGGVCINGMTNNSSLQQCFNSRGLGCDNGGMCSTSSCGGPAVLAVYNFSNTSASNLGADFLSATNSAILPVSNLPGVISPYKMFAVSDLQLVGIDTIYLVDHTIGFWATKYNTLTGQTVTPWFQILPYQSTTTVSGTTTVQTLIDVGYFQQVNQPSQFLVAFHQTVTVGVNPPMSNDVLYLYTNGVGSAPFNPQPGSGLTGTQYTTANVPLTISYVDISPVNNVSAGGDALIVSAGSVYLKLASQTKYSIANITGGPFNGQAMTGTTGPVRFYYDVTVQGETGGPPVCPSNGSSPVACPSANNIAFVKPSVTGAVQYSGNLASLIMPVDRNNLLQYNVFDFDIGSNVAGNNFSGTIALNTSAAGTNVALGFSATNTAVPYRVSSTSRSAVSDNAFYVISVGSCN
jgi:hypothetical protein